ncbi:MAG: type III pantothenate kinase [Vicinamibacterales bacterium]
MLLAIDVGNSNIVIGVFDGAKLTATWRLQTERDRTAGELSVLVDGFFVKDGMKKSAIEGAVVSSVVPSQTGPAIGMVRHLFDRDALLVEPAVNGGMPIRYERPADLGADRLVTAVGAYAMFGEQAGLPLIVCDFGTATKIDAVSAAGEYLGGTISAGVSILADALSQRTALLPLVEIRKPASVIGRTTVSGIEAGLFYGYLGMVEGIITRMRAELGGKAICVATGGLAPLIAPETTLIDHTHPDLTLQGMRIVWERNMTLKI